MYRSVTQSRPTRSRRRLLYRVEGVAVGIAVFLAVFYVLGWFSTH